MSLWTWLLVGCPSSSCVSNTDELITVATREVFIKLVTEVSVEFQPLSFLFIQQKAIDVGEKLIRRHRGNEALSVHPELIQQHHAEVESGDSEHLSTEITNQQVQC